MQDTWVRSLGLERSLREGNGNPLQYSCLENPKDRGAWRATTHGVAKSRTRLKRLGMHATCQMTSPQSQVAAYHLFCLTKMNHRNLNHNRSSDPCQASLRPPVSGQFQLEK